MKSLDDILLKTWEIFNLIITASSRIGSFYFYADSRLKKLNSEFKKKTILIEYFSKTEPNWMVLLGAQYVLEYVTLIIFENDAQCSV